MKFVCNIKKQTTRAVIAHMFLKRAYDEHRLNEISNMEDVIEALNPSNVLDEILGMIDGAYKSSMGIDETN